MDIFAFTPHQLDTLRTYAAIVGAIGTFLIAVNTVLTFLVKRTVKRTEQNTTTTQWADGNLHSVSVAESAHRILNTTEELRGELTHSREQTTAQLHDLLPRQHGRRRLATTDIPVSGLREIRKPEEESHYE